MADLDELVGRVGDAGPADVLRALGMVREGRIYDLDSGRFNGMAQPDVHPTYSLLTYRTPRSLREEGDVPLFSENNEADFSVLTELIVSTMHIGTHIDALCHAGCGDEWYGGFAPTREASDFGAPRGDAASIPPIIVQGVLLDAAGEAGVDHLAPGTGLDSGDLERIVATQGTPVPSGSAVFIRSGAMRHWQEPARFSEIASAGIDRDGAAWLADAGAVLVGSDTPTVEQMPSSTPGHPHPVHDLLISQSGVHLVENAYLEELADAGVHEFCLICLPLKIKGATGSMVRPVAMV